MGRGVAVVVVALLVALPAGAARPRLPRATTARDGTILIGGKPQFLIGAGWPTPGVIERELALGIGILQSNGPGATQLAISQTVGAKGFVPRLFQIVVVRDGKVAEIQDYGRREEAYAAAGLNG